MQAADKAENTVTTGTNSWPSSRKGTDATNESEKPVKLGRNGSLVCRCIFDAPASKTSNWLLKYGAQFGDKTSRLPQHLFDFIFLLRVGWLFKPSELIALSQHVEERNEMMPKFIHSFFHSRLFTIKIAQKFPNGSKPRLPGKSPIRRLSLAPPASRSHSVVWLASGKLIGRRSSGATSLPPLWLLFPLSSI